MSMGIAGFYNQALQKDFSRDFLMRVVNMKGAGVEIKEEDNVYITTSILPGYAIANQTVPFMGLSFNVPGGGQFPGSESWAVTFRCDQELKIREKFLDWQRNVFNAFPNSGANSTGLYYPKDSNDIISLSIFDRDGVPVDNGIIALIGAYPVSIGPINYNVEGTGAVVTFEATLAYQWWEKGTGVISSLGGDTVN